MEIIKIFLDNLRELMEDGNINIPGLAVAIGRNKSAISRWFHERYLPDPSTLIALADYFGCSVDYLFGLSDSVGFVSVPDERRFYERFTELRDGAGVTDYRVAKECNLQKSTVSKWKEVERPEAVSLYRLAKFFDCSMEFLLGRSRE